MFQAPHHTLGLQTMPQFFPKFGISFLVGLGVHQHRKGDLSCGNRERYQQKQHKDTREYQQKFSILRHRDEKQTEKHKGNYSQRHRYVTRPLRLIPIPTSEAASLDDRYYQLLVPRGTRRYKYMRKSESELPPASCNFSNHHHHGIRR